MDLGGRLGPPTLAGAWENFPIIYTIALEWKESRNLFKYVYNLTHIKGTIQGDYVMDWWGGGKGSE